MSLYADPSDPNGLLASSHLGHRLTSYTHQHKPEVESALAMELMNNYHVKGKSPSDRNELARIATKYGVFETENAAKAWLSTNDQEAEVQKGYAEATQKGISGVPFFIFNDKYATSGAVGVDEFEGALEQILK